MSFAPIPAESISIDSAENDLSYERYKVVQVRNNQSLVSILRFIIVKQQQQQQQLTCEVDYFDEFCSDSGGNYIN